MHLNLLTRFTKIILVIGVLLIAFWLSLSWAMELLRHRMQTLDFLVSMNAVRPYLLVIRLVVYLGCYLLWGWMLRTLKPTIKNESIALTRQCLVRFFVVYELLFGINIVALLMPN